MIFLTRLNKEPFFINPDHIVSIEETPDTVITLFNDHHFIVRESAQAIIDKIVSFRSRIIRRAGAATGKRNMSRTRQRQFQNVHVHSDERGAVVRGSKLGPPFHTQDF